MKLIVGLGNIGKEYDKTRHNVGFMVADEIAKKWKETNWKKADNATYIEHRMPEKVFLIKPTTYMNLSGLAVHDFASFYNIAPEDILIIHDDLDLSCGQLRLRKKGSPGGHNGLKSIEQQLGTQEYPRIKIGIGREGRTNKSVIKHVLQKFSTFEEDDINEGVFDASEAAILWLQGDIDTAMQRYNKKKEKVVEPKVDQIKR